MGGVGGQLPRHPSWSFYVVILGSRLNGVWMNEIFISQRISDGIRLLLNMHLLLHLLHLASFSFINTSLLFVHI